MNKIFADALQDGSKYTVLGASYVPISFLTASKDHRLEQGTTIFDSADAFCGEDGRSLGGEGLKHVSNVIKDLQFCILKKGHATTVVCGVGWMTGFSKQQKAERKAATMATVLAQLLMMKGVCTVPMDAYRTAADKIGRAHGCLDSHDWCGARTQAQFFGMHEVVFPTSDFLQLEIRSLIEPYAEALSDHSALDRDGAAYDNGANHHAALDEDSRTGPNDGHRSTNRSQNSGGEPSLETPTSLTGDETGGHKMVRFEFEQERLLMMERVEEALGTAGQQQQEWQGLPDDVPRSRFQGSVDEQRIKEVGLMGEFYFSNYLKKVFGGSYEETKNWVSSARNHYLACSREGVNDGAGYDFAVHDTLNHFVTGRKTGVHCYIEVKSCAGPFRGEFHVSDNEIQVCKQVKGKEDCEYLLVFIEHVDDMDRINFCHHVLWTGQGVDLKPNTYTAALTRQSSKNSAHHEATCTLGPANYPQARWPNRQIHSIRDLRPLDLFEATIVGFSILPKTGKLTFANIRLDYRGLERERRLSMHMSEFDRTLPFERFAECYNNHGTQHLCTQCGTSMRVLVVVTEITERGPRFSMDHKYLQEYHQQKMKLAEAMDIDRVRAELADVKASRDAEWKRMPSSHARQGALSQQQQDMQVLKEAHGCALQAMQAELSQARADAKRLQQKLQSQAHVQALALAQSRSLSPPHLLARVAPVVQQVSVSANPTSVQWTSPSYNTSMHQRSEKQAAPTVPSAHTMRTDVRDGARKNRSATKPSSNRCSAECPTATIAEPHTSMAQAAVGNFHSGKELHARQQLGNVFAQKLAAFDAHRDRSMHNSTAPTSTPAHTPTPAPSQKPASPDLVVDQFVAWLMTQPRNRALTVKLGPFHQECPQFKLWKTENYSGKGWKDICRDYSDRLRIIGTDTVAIAHASSIAAPTPSSVATASIATPQTVLQAPLPLPSSKLDTASNAKGKGQMKSQPKAATGVQAGLARKHPKQLPKQQSRQKQGGKQKQSDNSTPQHDITDVTVEQLSQQLHPANALQTCSVCKLGKTRESFSKTQRQKSAAVRKCSQCTRNSAERN